MPYINGASTGDVSADVAIHIPKELIPDCITGQITESNNEIIDDQRITTRGTNLFPLKNESASGSLRKL